MTVNLEQTPKIILRTGASNNNLQKPNLASSPGKFQTLPEAENKSQNFPGPGGVKHYFCLKRVNMK